MKLLIIDAFTDRPFAGNPAAGCLLAQQRDGEWMQAVAERLRQFFDKHLRGKDVLISREPIKSER